MKEPFLGTTTKSSITKFGYIDKDPFEETNFFGRFFFQWAYRIIALSKKTLLKTEYLGKLPRQYQSKVFLNSVKVIWDIKQYKRIKCYPLLWTSIRASISSIIIVFICTIINSALNILLLVYFREFVKIFRLVPGETPQPATKKNIYLGVQYLITRLISFILERKTTELLNFIGYKSGVELNCLIYDKLLKLSPGNQVKSGEIYNFIQNDSHKLSNLMASCPNLLTVPFLMIACNFLLFKYLEISFIYGFVVMIIFLAMNYYYRKQFSLYLKLHLKKSDQRMKIITETFNNLKVIKLNGWDNIFLPRIEKARKEELEALENRFKITQISQTLLWLAPIAMSVASIGAYQYYNDSFKIEDMFTALGIFTYIQIPMKSLPTTFDNILETVVSLRRIEKFMKETEINKKTMIRNDEKTSANGIAIKVAKGNYTWGKSHQPFQLQQQKQASKGNSNVIKQEGMINANANKDKDTHEKLLELINVKLKVNEEATNSAPLFASDSIDNKQTFSNNRTGVAEVILKNINLEIKKGEFVCIIGDVGSGKSSLLQAIMNNMISTSPRHTKLIVNGDISYVSQEAWIQNTTVQNNIIFFHPFDQVKYSKIIELCELSQDLQVLVGGDLTEIGEKGVNLSGGQKARISLARAMYTDKDIFILDDPISALDAHVGKNIMINCIAGYLQNKTRILVTHALQYTSYADRIIYMQDGEVYWSGTYSELISQPFYKIFYDKMNSKNVSKEEKNGSSADSKAIEPKRTISSSSIDEDKGGNGTKLVKRITKDEEKEVGKIDNKVYFSYFGYVGGSCFISSLIFNMVTWQTLKAGSDMFLGYWGDNQKKEDNLKFFAVYATMALSSTIFNYLRTYTITTGSIRCSVRLHTEMILNLISAPINLFHDTIPKGQIFNRLSKDLPTVDTYTMFWLMTLTSFGASFFGAVAMTILYEPHCSYLLIVFMVLCWFICRFYMNCSRELTRIEGIMNSPILNLINETIPGATTIRAYDFEEIYKSNFQSRVDEHFKVRMFLNGTSQWYLMSLNLLSFIFLVFLVTFTLYSKTEFTSKSIGILLTYSIILQEDLIQFLSSFSSFENTMTKMERSLSYTKIISERPQKLPVDNDYPNWPTKGEIEFVDYSARYRPETDLVLKDISFVLKAGEKLGVVGRTGSGKSTISLCLFRILEAYKGKIVIDGVDISTLGLNKLRSNLTIIPQDATLFEGSLKYNIDPLNQHSAEEISWIMKQIGFDYIINNHSEGLNQSITENGANLSIGEKQLICITRAILRKSKIVIMDEATASIDFKTEEIIQKAITQLLTTSTMIVIAHRIKTVINSDKILVLDKGEIVEYDSPHVLLQNPNSFFYDFYSKSAL